MYTIKKLIKRLVENVLEYFYQILVGNLGMKTQTRLILTAPKTEIVIKWHNEESYSCLF